MYFVHAQTISTIAGTGAPTFFGDNGAATNAALNKPFGLAVDTLGNLFIADRSNNRIRKIAPNGIITTVAGNGSGGFAGDAGPATDASIFDATGIAVDKSGAIYIADKSNNRVRKVDTFGIITTVAGTGAATFAGDGGLATNAGLNNPRGVAIDQSGNIYIADQGNSRVRIVSPTGIINTFAGNGTLAFSGDGGPASTASLNNPFSLAIDQSGNLYIADVDNERIRKVNTSGIITTFAGGGGAIGDGGLATLATLNEPTGIAIDNFGTTYIADGWDNRIRAVGQNGIINTVAGTGATGFSGDGGMPIYAELYNPYGIAINKSGTVFIADNGNNRIRAMGLPTIVDKNIYIKNTELYPNPNNGKFIVNFHNNFDLHLQVLVLDATGKLIKCMDSYSNTPINFDVSEPTGTYFIKASNNNQVWYSSFEINKE